MSVEVSRQAQDSILSLREKVRELSAKVPTEAEKVQLEVHTKGVMEVRYVRIAHIYTFT